MTRLQFCAYLRHTLIPDLRAAEMDATADDFETALQFITEDALVISDCAEDLIHLAKQRTKEAENLTAKAKELTDKLKQ